jgi:CRISPR-associated protein Csb2
MLALEVVLLTGRYVATAYNDRQAAEWPPHPARLFSALVAAHFEQLDPPEDERDALRWLETQGAPEIVAPRGAGRDVVTVFVPVNDTSVIGSLDSEAAAVAAAREELQAARAAGGKAVAKAEKNLAKVEAKLAEATRKAIAPVPAGKEGKEAPSQAESLLPERRTRQPRTFPSIAPAALEAPPRIVFTWPHGDPPPQHRAALDRLAERVVRLGHSSSLVTARLVDEVPAPGPHEQRWIPAEGDDGGAGQVLRVVGPGQLAATCEAFTLYADAPGRQMPASYQRYLEPRERSHAPAPAPVLGEDWIVLRRVEGPDEQEPSPRLPSSRAVDVARAVRSSLLAAYGPDAPEILSGHRAPGQPAEQPHLAFVPLPSLGHHRADGALLGVALVFPRASTRDDRAAVLSALQRWEEKAGEDDDTGRVVPLLLGKAGKLWLLRLGTEATQANLRASTWCSEARSWASATPVALDRNPRELRSKDARKEAAAYAEAEEIVALSCERIGLPRPARVTVTPAAPLAGRREGAALPCLRYGQTAGAAGARPRDAHVRGPRARADLARRGALHGAGALPAGEGT